MSFTISIMTKYAAAVSSRFASVCNLFLILELQLFMFILINN